MKRPAWLVAAASSALIVAIGCTSSPLGRRQLILMPDSQMAEMGVAAFNEFKTNKSKSSDQQASAFVDCVAKAVISALDPAQKRQGWEVVLFVDDSANAFALPGAKIGVNTGLLELAQTQAQLAAVIGHELAHVLAQHANERMSTSTLAELGMAAIDASSALSPSAMSLLGLGTQVGILLPYSRVHESEADLIGIDLMARAGFDPTGAIELWRNMAANRDGAETPALLSTHPSDQARTRRLRGRLPAARRLYEQALAAGRRPICKRALPLG